MDREPRVVQFVAGDRLAILTPGGCQVRDVWSGALVRSFRPSFADLGCFSSNGRRLLTTIASEQKHNIYLWDVETGQLLLTLPHDLTRVSGLAFSSDGKWLAAGGEREGVGAVRVWSSLSPPDRHEVRLRLPAVKS
jgi:WD40 repeat protein